MRSNSKQVKDAIRVHISEYYTPEELADQVSYMRDSSRRMYPTEYHAVYAMVEGGCFLIYNNDIVNFLNGLGINSSNKQYDVSDSFKLYCHLIARDAQLILKHAN